MRAAVTPAAHDPIRTIMSSPVVTINANATLSEVVDLLAEMEVGALVVLDEDNPIGVISERDIVRTIAADGAPDQVWAGDVASFETVWATANDSIARVASLMREASVRHIPVRQDDEVVGMVSIRDVLEVLLSAVEE